MTFGEALDKVASVVRDQYLQMQDDPEALRRAAREIMKYMRRLGLDSHDYNQLLAEPLPAHPSPFVERVPIPPRDITEQAPVPPEDITEQSPVSPTEAVEPQLPESPRPGAPESSSGILKWIKEHPWLAGGGAAGLTLLAAMPLAYMLWKKTRKGEKQEPPRSMRRGKVVEE